MFVDVSAKPRINIDGLLEAVLLTADAALDLRANPKHGRRRASRSRRTSTGPWSGGDRAGAARHAAGRRLDRGRSGVRPGPGHARRARRPVEEAGPSRPVLVLGLTAVPGAGDKFLVVEDDRMPARSPRGGRRASATPASAKRRARRTLEDLMASMEQGEAQELLLILKGDVSGSVEALEDALVKIEVGDEVNLRVIDRGVGAINQNDVNLAVASNAVIIGFNVRPEGKAGAGRARGRGCPVLLGHLLGDRRHRGGPEGHAQADLRGGPARPGRGPGDLPLLEGGQHRRLLVTSGLIRRNAKVRLIRDGAVVVDNTDAVVAEAVQGRRVRGPRGLRVRSDLNNFNDIKIGDVVEAFELREKPRS